MEKITWFRRGEPIEVPIERCMHFLADGKLVQFSYLDERGLFQIAYITGISVGKLYSALKGKFVYVRHGFIVKNERVGFTLGHGEDYRRPVSVYVKGFEHIRGDLTAGSQELITAQLLGDHVKFCTKTNIGGTLVMLPGEPGERVRKKVVIEEIGTAIHRNWCGNACFEIAVIDKHGRRYTELNDHFQLYGVNK
ncbi:hypothetical protein [Pseudomonas phage vB_Pae_TUMS_P11]|nr:hypothetical protein [Pseudomonas phage vB_Pae_TUMS_P11]